MVFFRCNFQHVCNNEAENREWLKKHDAPLYNLLAKVYTNNHPTIPSGLKVCQWLTLCVNKDGVDEMFSMLVLSNVN
jgi:hypothetical protein